MINHDPIFASADMGTNREKTKYGPFYKDLGIAIIFLWDLCIMYLGELKFGCIINYMPISRTVNIHSFSSRDSF